MDNCSSNSMKSTTPKQTIRLPTSALLDQAKRRRLRPFSMMYFVTGICGLLLMNCLQKLGIAPSAVTSLFVFVGSAWVTCSWYLGTRWIGIPYCVGVVCVFRITGPYVHYTTLGLMVLLAKILLCLGVFTLFRQRVRDLEVLASTAPIEDKRV